MKYKALEAMGEAYKGLGIGSDDVRLKWKGWQIDRTGSVEDYNTDYVQAEFEIIAQGIAQLETREVMDRIQALTDVTQNLQSQGEATELG